jgi:DNA-binding transcriptional LysR family regulator
MIDNIALYRFFVVAASAGSISNAAKKLYVTQPAVSSGITQLEDTLGVKLFFRTSKGITLTPEGEILNEYASYALRLLETGEDKLRDLAGLSSGILRIGASDMTLKFYLLNYIEKFNALYPKIKITVSNKPTPDTIRELNDGTIDLCVISEPVRDDIGIKFRPVKQIRDIAVVKTGGRYSRFIGRTVTWSELKGETVIMLERGTSTRVYLDKFLKTQSDAAYDAEPSIELAQSDLIIEFVQRDLGIGFIVEDFVSDALSGGLLTELTFDRPIPCRNFLLGHINRVPLSSAAKEFMRLLE